MKQIDSLLVDASEVSGASRRDPILSTVLRYQRNEWPKKVSEGLQPYHSGDSNETAISSSGGAPSWSTRRTHAWWPGIDAQIEDAVRACEACQQYRKAPPAAPLHAWSWPSTPWDHVHVDFPGPFMGKMLRVVTDSHSKWPEVVVMRSTTAASTIEVLRNIFARNGLPRHLVSDNRPQFIAEEFKQFMRNNGIRHS